MIFGKCHSLWEYCDFYSDLMCIEFSINLIVDVQIRLQKHKWITIFMTRRSPLK